MNHYLNTTHYVRWFRSGKPVAWWLQSLSLRHTMSPSVRWVYAHALLLVWYIGCFVGCVSVVEIAFKRAKTALDCVFECLVLPLLGYRVICALQPKRSNPQDFRRVFGKRREKDSFLYSSLFSLSLNLTLYSLYTLYS